MLFTLFHRPSGSAALGFLALLAAASWLACSPARAERVALEADLRARVLAPGEPVRIVVSSPAELGSLEGSFLGQDLFFVRMTTEERGGEVRELWSGWSMIGLDETAASAAVELRGRAVDGREALGTRVVSIEPKEFPTEELKVSSKYVSPPPEVDERLTAERKKLAGIYVSRSRQRPSTDAFVRPVPGDPTSTFGTRRLFNGQPRSPHPGLDLRASEGTDVRSSGAGRVVLAQDLYYSGNCVIVDHGGGLFTLYAHLSEIGVEEGENVTPGELVGKSGSTGRVTGPHLHWGAKIGNRPFDPTALLDPELFGP